VKFSQNSVSFIKHRERFVDLGSEYFNRINAKKIFNRKLRSLEKLGVDISNLTMPA